jgi:hypothetical protein
LAWSKITGTPTTIAGYGITDAVSTSGSYANPSWITSLAGSKITGNISGSAANVTGIVAIANGGTNKTSYTVSGTGTRVLVYDPSTGAFDVVSAGTSGQFLRSSGTTGDVLWATPPNFTSSTAGYAPASGGGTTNFLRADGTWAAPPTTTTISANNVTAGTFPGTLYTFAGSARITEDLIVDTNTFVVDSVNNRVGVGTATPSNTLHVAGSGTVARMASATTDSSVTIAHSGNGGLIGFRSVGAGPASNVFYVTTGAGTFGSGFVMDNNGGFGIGTTTTTNAKFTVNKNIRIDDDLGGAGSDTFTLAPSLYIGSTTGGASLQYNASRGWDLWQFNTSGNWARTVTFARDGQVGIGTTSPNVSLDVNGTVRSRLGAFQLNDGTSTGGGLYFYKTITGSGSNLSPSLFSETGMPLYFMTNGSASIKGTLSIDGNWTVTGNVVAYSDARVKENVRVIDNALARVRAIRGVTFTRTDMQDTAKRHAGVIAQEIEAVLPEVISDNDDGMKSVAYGNITALLIEAIKELQDEVTALRGMIKT